ncbi:HTTM domain-containing protein [Pseudenhygromyxa sp. WMMC2535]|uniref:HTTM domain-containing protein n=1 Tax=Pseudenhygromyxa sp. WMMC2535 TaxID=2712867 RepID=UPI00155310D5|nr:HTTM domain-containing protein [Pseudenhygromyxa sp. WMMC2535]NVB38157.1 HTTM domain-containing protein [Pseudenhygromyxa sp. WMMC2535]
MTGTEHQRETAKGSPETHGAPPEGAPENDLHDGAKPSPRLGERLRERATARVDPGSVVVLRLLVGLLLFVSIARFVARGWVETLLLAPDFHFRYWGFEWVPVPGATLAYGLFALTGAAALGLAMGVRVRLCAALAFSSFTWLELIDLTYYLNHYVFLSALLLTFALVPPRPGPDGKLPAWALWLIRTQVGLVYVYAGIAKLGADWLLGAQPLTIWLARHSDMAIVGPWLDEPFTAYAASWAGAIFDLLVVPALLWRPTRAWAYLGVVGFHLVTGFLFPIGMFPWFMIGCATIFFAPAWPRRWLAPGTLLERPAPTARPRLDRALGVVAALSLGAQLLMPWRYLLYPGSVLWHEQGMRYSYRVMLVEKGGAIEFRVHDRSAERSWYVDPRTELTPLQVKSMSTQPDLIAAYARALAARLEHQRPGARIEVYADAFVAVNGRPSARLIDPTVDLASVEDGLWPKPWILPGPEDLR